MIANWLMNWGDCKVLTCLSLGGVQFFDGVIEPNVGDGHSILRQRARLVRADGRRRTERFDCLQILDEAIPFGHSFRRQC